MRLCHAPPGDSDASLAIEKEGYKFALTRIFPTNTECKNCHQQESKTTQHFFHTPSGLKVIVCHLYPVEDCVKGLQGNSFKLPYK